MAKKLIKADPFDKAFAEGVPVKPWKSKGWDMFEMYEPIMRKPLPKGPKYGGKYKGKEWVAANDAYENDILAQMRTVINAEKDAQFSSEPPRSNAARVIRAHCAAMAKCGKGWCPMSKTWEAISKIDKTCDHTVLVLADKLLEMMWT